MKLIFLLMLLFANICQATVVFGPVNFSTGGIGDLIDLFGFYSHPAGTWTVQADPGGFGSQVAFTSSGGLWKTSFIGSTNYTDGEIGARLVAYGTAGAIIFRCNTILAEDNAYPTDGYSLLHVGGVWDLRRQADGFSFGTVSPVGPGPWDFVLRCTGTRIQGFVDGVRYWDVTDSTTPFGKPGVISVFASTYITNIYVDDLIAVPTPVPSVKQTVRVPIDEIRRVPADQLK